jgi:hypothetical protein
MQFYICATVRCLLEPSLHASRDLAVLVFSIKTGDQNPTRTLSY